MYGLNYIERIVIALVLFFDMSYAMAQQKLPGDAEQYLPVLNLAIDSYWPDLSSRSWMATIPDQEANWKIKATLKTSRELGCGLGQFTIAYNADGSTRFDALAETRRLHPDLKGWDWKDCYNVKYQLSGLVLKMRTNERSCLTVMRGDRNVKACNGASYNGGFGSVTKRIRLCKIDENCDPQVWFNNLDQKCAQSNVKVAGYGESFCQINAKYPGRVEARQVKFLPRWPGEKPLSELDKK